MKRHRYTASAMRRPHRHRPPVSSGWRIPITGSAQAGTAPASALRTP
jgi:hypothetical protein